MADNSPYNKITANSQIQKILRSNQMLPFIKPRYLKEEMHTNRKTRSNDPTSRSKPNRNHTECLRSSKSLVKVGVEPDNSELQRDCTFNTDLIKFRYKILDRNRNTQKEKLKAETVATEIQAKDQSKQESKIYFSLIRRRKRHKNFIDNKEEIVNAPQQINSLEKTIQIPSFLNKVIRQARTKIKIDQTHERIGSIRRQFLKDFKAHQQELERKQLQKQLNRLKAKKNFKKIGNAVLFIFLLKRYNLKFQSRRKRFLERAGASNIQQRLLELKMYFSQKLLVFFENSFLTFNRICYIVEKDSHQIRSQKIQSIRKLIGILIECISKGINELKERTNLIEIIYSICKHGSFSCLWQLHTPQELDISCISPEVGYLCGDNYLERSYIISLIFIKIIIYNILLKPELITHSLTPLADRTKFYSNVKLIANIFYQMLISLQDNYLELADETFKIANWRNLTYKFYIRSSQSMTVKSGVFQQNQLISGLIGHHYLVETYRINEMAGQQKMIRELVINAHNLIKEHHYRIRQGCI